MIRGLQSGRPLFVGQNGYCCYGNPVILKLLATKGSGRGILRYMETKQTPSPLLDASGKPIQNIKPKPVKPTAEEAQAQKLAHLQQVAQQDQRVGRYCQAAQEAAFQGWLAANITPEEKADLERTMQHTFEVAVQKAMAFYQQLDNVQSKFFDELVADITEAAVASAHVATDTDEAASE